MFFERQFLIGALYLGLQESREGRVASWKNFQSGSSKDKDAGPSAPAAQAAPAPKKAKKITQFRPPKHKAESR